MSALLKLLDLDRGADADTWIGPASGPAGKRSYGGQFVAQSLAAACHTRLQSRSYSRRAKAGSIYRPTLMPCGRVSQLGGHSSVPPPDDEALLTEA